jgi:hypothetical protein
MDKKTLEIYRVGDTFAKNRGGAYQGIFADLEELTGHDRRDLKKMFRERLTPRQILELLRATPTDKALQPTVKRIINMTLGAMNSMDIMRSVMKMCR